MSDTKPGAAKLGWHLAESRTHFENHISKLREDILEVPDKGRTSYAYVERSEAIIVVPVTSKGEIILIRQYRYPVDEWCLEVPAGGCHDANGASLEEVVKKELREEVGATAGEVQYVSFFYSSNSLSDEKCHVFLALNAELEGRKKPEATEALETVVMPARDAVRLVHEGKMKTGPCALAVLLCEDKLRQLGVLD